MDQCKNGKPGAVITEKEFDLCRDELTDEQDSKKQLFQNLKIAKRNIKTLEDEKEVLQNQLNSEKAGTENLRNRIRQLENEKTRIQSESARNQRESADKVHRLTNESQNLQSSLDFCQGNQKMDCDGPIVGYNGLSLLKKPSEIQVCQDYGIYDEPENSILIFDDDAIDGNNERAVITRALSNYLDKTDGKYKIGNKDKIITSFNTNGNVKYDFDDACGVTYQGLIHFFGGYFDAYENQHFGFDEKRNFVKYKNLEIDFRIPQCSNFKISKPNSQSSDKEVVLLCFDMNHKENCYQYDDGELTHFADAYEDHYSARLGKYKDQLVTVGDSINNQETEILDRSYNGEYKWTLGPNYNFSPYGNIYAYSMVNVPQMGLNEEYLLLIGGMDLLDNFYDKVHKYNGKWTFFGNLQKTRANHSSVFLNGRVLIIGGWETNGNKWMKTETWESSKSRFETESTWPELNYWSTWSNHVFIIPDYINP